MEGLFIESTSISLLRRLRQPNEDAAWQRFVDLYAPLIYYWGRGQGLTDADASELVQEVMAVMVAKLPEFQYDPRRRFRGWLRTIAVNKARDYQRREAVRPATGQNETIERVAVGNTVDLFEESEYQAFVVSQALKLMRDEFNESTWKACWGIVAEGRPAADLAAELDTTASAVYAAKYRVMKRLREELEGLTE